jgi:hypothetical protein
LFRMSLKEVDTMRLRIIVDEMARNRKAEKVLYVQRFK